MIMVYKESSLFKRLVIDSEKVEKHIIDRKHIEKCIMKDIYIV